MIIYKRPLILNSGIPRRHHQFANDVVSHYKVKSHGVTDVLTVILHSPVVKGLLIVGELCVLVPDLVAKQNKVLQLKSVNRHVQLFRSVYGNRCVTWVVAVYRTD